jgi:hypothetical protein
MPDLLRKYATRLALAVVAAAVLGGCKKPQIQVYVAPRDPERKAPSAPVADALPELTWTLPAGWKQTAPGQMSLASFAAGESATVNITPLPNLKGREEAVVNMWREQVGLGPLPQEELEKVLQPAEIAGEQGQAFEINGTSLDGKPSRTITGILHRDSKSWFFKLSGEDTAVAAQKAAFFEFLKSIRIVDPAAAAQASNPSEPSAPQSTNEDRAFSFKWEVPQRWQKLPAGQMQVAKFAVAGEGEAKAEVSVSVFPSDTGGTLANVNRWRRQLGLGEVDEHGLQSCITGLDVAPGAVLVNLSNEQKHLLGAIVPRSGKWWFYKMMGDAAAVAAAREDFVKFASANP